MGPTAFAQTAIAVGDLTAAACPSDLTGRLDEKSLRGGGRRCTHLHRVEGRCSEPGVALGDERTGLAHRAEAERFEPLERDEVNPS